MSDQPFSPTESRLTTLGFKVEFARAAVRCFAVISLLVLSAIACRGQEDVLLDIREYASRHVQAGSEMKTELVVALFRENGAGLSNSDVAEAYEAEYLRLIEIQPKEQDPLLTVLIASIASNVILFLLLLVRDALKKVLVAAWGRTTEFVINRSASTRWGFRAQQLLYRREIRGRFEAFTILFRPGEQFRLDEAYVPARVLCRSGRERTMLGIPRKQGLTVVLGPPGSGKSMYLQHAMYSFSIEGAKGTARSPLPVFISLPEVADGSMSLEASIAEELRESGIKNAESFLQVQRPQGGVALLLDSLDEVDTSSRGAVVAELRRLIRKYRTCPVVLTCRTAVYQHELDSDASEICELLEFSDLQLYRFLRGWEVRMPAGKTIEQLLQTLRDRPRVIALARNPLLLTMIAHLYSATEFQLPKSRAELHANASTLLLHQWRNHRNRIPWQAKKSVLQHLALISIDTSRSRQLDRRTLPYDVVLVETGKMLGRLNLGPEVTASGLIDEIVAESGLLLSVDGGQRYAFAHLSQEEYLAAEEMRNTADSLLSRLMEDEPLWAETARLWCGLARDATSFVDRVWEIDQLLALECLSDAQIVDKALARRVVGTYQEAFGTGDTRVVHAFGALATDSSDLGRQVLDFLKITLNTSKDPDRRAAAAQSLSLTNLPEAASILVNRYADGHVDRQPVVRMGDVAVPPPIALSKKGIVLDAVDDIAGIGTPHAASSMVPLLWSDNTSLATRAAWSLLALLAEPGISDTLELCELPAGIDRHPQSEWVWRPFQAGTSSCVPAIAARILDLVTERSTELPGSASRQCDWRIGLPAILQLASRENLSPSKILSCTSLEDLELPDALQKPTPREMIYDRIWEHLPRPQLPWRHSSEEDIHSAKRAFAAEQVLNGIARLATETGDADLRKSEEDAFSRVSEAMNPSTHLLRLLRGLHWRVRALLIPALLGSPTPSKRDWTRSRGQADYRYFNSRIFHCVLAILTAIWLAAMGHMLVVALLAESWTHSLFVMALATILAVAGVRIVRSQRRDRPFRIESFLIALLGWPFLFLVIPDRGTRAGRKITGIMSGLLEAAVLPAVILFEVLHFPNHSLLLALLASLALVLVVLWRLGKRKERRPESSNRCALCWAARIRLGNATLAGHSQQRMIRRHHFGLGRPSLSITPSHDNHSLRPLVAGISLPTPEELCAGEASLLEQLLPHRLGTRDGDLLEQVSNGGCSCPSVSSRHEPEAGFP